MNDKIQTILKFIVDNKSANNMRYDPHIRIDVAEVGEELVYSAYIDTLDGAGVAESVYGESSYGSQSPSAAIDRLAEEISLVSAEKESSP